jgi:1,5-anhydro-D-fructose reductase (1,5-anhydro-D-mannitol-forming)
MTIGWALYGAGRHAARSVVPEMKAAKDARLVAVIGRDAARGESFAATHGFAKVHLSLADALADPAIDAIYDATPDGLHAANGVAAAEAGKHILIEKPLANSVADGVRAVAAAARHGIVLGVVFNQRHDAVHRAARKLVADGAIGTVAMARVQLAMPPRTASPPPAGGNWRTDPAMRPRGVASSIGDHAFDTLAYLVGQDIETVAAATAVPGPGGREQFAALTLGLADGAVGHAVASYAMPYAQRPLEIHGSEGSLILHNSYAYLVGAEPDPRPRLELVNADGRTVRQFPQTPCFRLEIEQFNRAVTGEAQPMTPGADALRNLAVTEAIYGSIATGRVVRVADFLPAAG